MKLPLNLLNDFINLEEITPCELSKRLTQYSFEVEGQEEVGPNLKGPIVIGKILDIQKHPDADKLSVAKVTTDGKNELQIVCGAKNIKIGQYVPVSLEGAEVVNRQDGSKLKIKKSKIRGVESFGMLCSASELGLEGEDGILILEESAPLGENIINFLSLQKDTVLEVAARSNRGDALSILGLSREISAITNKKLKEVKFLEPQFDSSVDFIKSNIESRDDTPLFYAATLENVTISDSPFWLKSALRSYGIRSINNIVDITNLINFTFGQPMHAYDRDKLQGKTLIARRAKKGEEIITLDGKLRSLQDEVLIISDEKVPVAIAGVMGGKDSEVNNETKNIVLEAAIFSPFRVRKSARMIGLTSDASKRFERGVDSNFTYKALLKAIELILLIANKNNALKISSISKAGEEIKKEVKITISKNHVNKILGIDLPIEKIIDLLESVNFICKKTSVDSLEVNVPSYRQGDVYRNIDLVEEIARLYGYDNIPPAAPKIILSSSCVNSSENKLKELFLGAGFSEVYLSSLIGDSITAIDEFGFREDLKIEMLNPLSKEHSVLRQNLFPGLLSALKLNQGHQAPSVRMFEVGKSYFVKDDITEIKNISGIISEENISWLDEKSNLSSDKTLFFKTKGFLEGIFQKNNIKVRFSYKEYPFLHPSMCLGIDFVNEEEKILENIGFLGIFHPKFEKTLDIKGPICIFEFQIDKVLKKIENIKTFKKITSVPIVERDITVDLDKDILSGNITAIIETIVSNIVISINIVSVFELGKSKKSITYRVRMQGDNETLTSKEVDKEIDTIKNCLIKNFNAQFRG